MGLLIDVPWESFGWIGSRGFVLALNINCGSLVLSHFIAMPDLRFNMCHSEDF